MAKEKRATWWKMLYHQRAAIDSVSDEDAGAGLKAAFRYFDGEDIPPESLSLPAFTVFCVIRPYIDDAWRDYEKSVESGKEGARRRYNSPPIESLSPPMGVFREEEVEVEEEVEAEEERGADKPPTRTRFVPPTVEEVAEYVRERGSKVDPQGFINYYAARGWMMGKYPMTDWKAACRNAEHWERWDKKKDDPFPDYSGGESFV